FDLAKLMAHTSLPAAAARDDHAPAAA
ncbi:MAG: chemotaxis protein CheW, partial [Bradyrhizobiaceae bacterium]